MGVSAMRGKWGSWALCALLMGACAVLVQAKRSSSSFVSASARASGNATASANSTGSATPKPPPPPPPRLPAGFVNPLLSGGSMIAVSGVLSISVLTWQKFNWDDPFGEPINVVVSSKSSPSVLKPEGFLLWATALNFGVSCLGQGDSASFMYANLGKEAHNVRQGSASGNNGVLRYNYGLPSVGTCRETFQGGNHFRWFVQTTKQAGTAIFLAASLEDSLANAHTIQPNGYNIGRDQLVGNATQPNGISWGGHSFNATVEWIDAGILLNATSEGINHPEVAPPNGTAIDGRIAVLYVNAWLSDEGAPSSFATPGVRPTKSLVHGTLVAFMVATGLVLI